MAIGTLTTVPPDATAALLCNKAVLPLKVCKFTVPVAEPSGSIKEFVLGSDMPKNSPKKAKQTTRRGDDNETFKMVRFFRDLSSVNEPAALPLFRGATNLLYVAWPLAHAVYLFRPEAK